MKVIFTIIITICLALNAQTAKQMAKDLGIIDDQQIDSQARSRGIDLDLQSTESEIQPVGNLKGEKGADESTLQLADENEDPDENEDLSIETIPATGAYPLSYFGYKIFTGDPSVFQASTFGAVDPNYNIGPGDQIIVMLWGESQFRQEFTINREGYVFVPEVGQIFVNGLNLDALEKKFIQILSKVYSTLKPTIGKPTTFMDISLGNLRPLRIIVLGEVGQPGAYSVSPSTSLSSSLYYFLGPTTRGSLRDIRLLRNGKQVGGIDFYDYLLSGSTPDDPRLQLDDVVFLPPRGKTVTIRGEINREGIYELKEMEGLKDLLHIAGDPLVTAYMNRVQINRIVPVDDRSELGMDRMVIDINLGAAISNNEYIELHDGDILEIFSIEELQYNYVTLRSSSVRRPGKYQLAADMRVSDLVDAADGLLNDAYMYKAHITRIKDDLTTELITINLKNAMSGDLDYNIKLQFMDELIIYNENLLKNIFSNVTVSGPVKNPGSFTLKADEKLGDILTAAGGFNSGIQKVKIIIARQNQNSFEPIIFSIPTSPKNNQYFNINQLDNYENEVNQFILKKNDIISVYGDPRDQPPKIVKVKGAVYFPGDYPIRSSKEKVTDIIKRAGGLLPEAYPMASTFIRSGQVVRLSFKEILDNPNSKENFTLIPGDQIEILQKSNIVRIDGEVNNPGVFKFYNNSSLRDYIKIAGGLTVNAESKEIWLTYPNGNSRQLRRFYPAPRVYDGTIITIGRQEDSSPIDKTELAKEIASIIADFLQIALTLIIISNTTGG